MNRTGIKGIMVLSLSCMVLLSGCEWRNQPTMAERNPIDHQMESNATSSATEMEKRKDAADVGKHIDIINGSGAKIGSAMLYPLADGVKIQVEASGLAPGMHGIHIHQNGVCTAPDFTSAGAHLNPTGKQHGFDNPLGPHVGDLMNLEVGADGIGKAELVNKMVTLTKDKPNSLLKQGGTSLVIHEAADDYKTDPAGNSGARIACGVIL
jgi:Cu-Zn family superoxide dismutase